MKEKLEKILKNSKSPYYHYHVAAIIECSDGSLFEGVNVETSSPGAGICAERNALYSAITKGYDKKDFTCIHLMAENEDEIYPCFVCRAALVDYCTDNTEVKVYTKDKIIKKTIKELCVYAFSEDDLK